MGLEVIIAKHAGSARHYAGSIQQRLKDPGSHGRRESQSYPLQSRRIRCCASGGQLDFTRFRQHPKWLIGFSDITALHNVFQQNGFASLHAPWHGISPWSRKMILLSGIERHPVRQ